MLKRSWLCNVPPTVLLFLATIGWTCTTQALTIMPTKKDSMLAQTISRELERRHLASDVVLLERKPMVGQLILKAIDPARSLLTLQDIKNIPVKSLPNQIERGNLETMYRLYGLSLTRSRNVSISGSRPFQKVRAQSIYLISKNYRCETNKHLG